MTPSQQTSAVAEPIKQDSNLVAATGNRLSRVDGIDVLRGMSVLAVVVHHINLRIPIPKTPIGQHLSKQVISVLGWNGANAVTIFFAISGFLITSTCLQRWGKLGEIPLRAFYRLRFARIAPSLLGLLVLLSALHLAGVMPFVIDSHRASLARAVVAALTFHINWLEAHRGYLPGNWDVLWSLSVEEMFYLFFPLCCRWLRGGRMLVTLLLGFAIAGPFARTVLTHNQLWADYSYLSCMDAIALGCLAALIAHRFHLGPRLSMVVQGLGVIAVVLVTVFKRQVSQLGLYKSGLDMTVLALGVALTLMALAQRRQPGRSWTAPLRWLGRNSYEVYLTHMFVVFGLLQVFVAFGSPYRWAPLWYGIIVCLSGTLGALVARFYSEPLNRRLRAGGGVGAPHPSIS